MSGTFFGTFGPGPSGDIEDAEPWSVFRLRQAFRFDDPNGLAWEVPAGTSVNGASIPRAFWTLIGSPFTGRYFGASVIHDHYCVTRSRTAHDTHRMFFYGMRARDVPVAQAKAMYWAVATFGPDWALERGAEGPAAERPAPDLTDPVRRALAEAKAAAIARTLATTGGDSLDVTAHGTVDGSLDEIDAHAGAMREMLAGDAWRADPDLIGILAEPSHGDDFDTWAGDALPSFSDAPVLHGGMAPGSRGFRLDPADTSALESLVRRGPSPGDTP
jgi:hypothetical protein